MSTMFDPTQVEDRPNGGKLTESIEAIFIAESMERNEGKRAPYFNVCFRVITGPHSGAYLYDNMSLSEKALWRLGKLAVAMGQTETVDLDDDDDVADYFLDREFAGWSEIESDPQWGDRTRLNVQTLRPLSKDERKAVKAVYKEKGTSHDEGWRTPKATTESETDVPF